MAFNFNWSPLAADTDFYKRAQEMLTDALNKSPKPPIIVDDILVHEMNLGSVPPDLEILEIGDLAEDRFRGIFKMRYSGDAFLTLKTRVQANPLNTYLSTRPSFGSPEPLAAASGLTIPLKITLSDIKLSAFIILVFSKQKGITLVFRNDPLESLKVSSTFDSISFVRDYLQKEIEGQLRTLLMDQVPAIIHRLSLRLFVPEFREREDSDMAKATENTSEEAITDPLASPPQDPVDLNGNVLDPSQIASLSLDSSAETHSLFSQKNLIRLATLTDSNRTLSLFSPSMRDVVYRAWAGHMERGDSTGIQSPQGAALSRKHSQVATSIANTYTLSSAASDAGSQASHPSRPGILTHSSSFVGSNFGKHSKPGRRRKHRTINLRKPKTQSEDAENVSEEGSMSATMSSTTSDNGYAAMPPVEPEQELVTPPPSPGKARLRPRNVPKDFSLESSPQQLAEETPRPLQSQKHLGPPTEQPLGRPLFETGPSDTDLTGSDIFGPQLADSTATIRPKPTRYFGSWQPPPEPPQPGPSSINMQSANSSQKLAAPFPYSESNPGGILEQAWMMKMAGEIARRVSEQKAADAGFWDGRRGSSPPPAYAS